MKKLYTLLASFLITLTLFAQAPEKMSYQAVVRDANNALIMNQAVGMRIQILQGSVSGTTVYEEIQTPTSNDNGLVTLEIGTGTIVSGMFGTIDWSIGPYFIKTETDPTGATNYTISGTSQLMSVPYALYAKTSGNGAGPQGPAGVDGQDGAVGAQGPAGLDGTNGIDGAVGAQGPAGLDGTNGIDGQDGAQGPAGVSGTNGIDGQDGAQGPAGLDGTNGIDGQDGAVGAQGPAGVSGTNGIDGQDGAQGPAGLDGTNGAVGATGAQGPAGNDGATGPAGNDGAVGATGPQGPGSAQALSVSTTGDTLYLQNGGFVIVPGISVANGSLPAIGDNFQGGIVFYLDGNGGGLIAAPTDQSAGAQWGCLGTFISGADGTAIGTGNQNTTDIELGCTTAGTAADICANLTLGGYSDWFLPSKDELNEMYLNIGQGNALGLGNIGNFTSGNYWSSSDYNTPNNDAAWELFFGSFSWNGSARFNTDNIRAIRAF